ncbi:MAG: hypothetical protein J7K51_03445 [Thermotogae bacterium]|nr:hypothetical protein [Thermotogota bacterium]
MNFDWKDFVRLAEDLMKRPDEASLRSAISRAYYGVFCISRNKRGFKNYRPEKGKNIHWIVINEYKNSHNNNEEIIGKYLDDLRRNRNYSDYDEDKTIDFKLAQRVLIKAKQILDKLGIRL